MISSIRVNQLIGLAAAAAWFWAGSGADAKDTNSTVAIGGLEAFHHQSDLTLSDASLAGAMLFNKTSGPGTASFASVCTDVSATLFSGNNYSSAASAADIFHKYGNLLTTGTSDQKAGVQLAVWAALYNTSAGSTSISLDGAGFSVLGTGGLTHRVPWGTSPTGTQAAIADAQSYLNAVNFNDQHAGDLLVPAPLSQRGTPAQEVFGSVTPVPEPATMIAGAVLLLPFALSTIRLRKNRAA